MNNVSINNLSVVLPKLTAFVRADLERKYAGNCARYAVSAADLVGSAITYVSLGVVNGLVPEPKTAKDFYFMVSAKADNLLKDAYRRQKAAHGRRSVRASDSLDRSEYEDGTFTGVDRASYAKWRECQQEEEYRFRLGCVRKALDRVVKLTGISDRNACIYREIVLDEEPRERVAEKYGTTRNNCDVIVARMKSSLAKYGPEAFAEVYALAA